MHRGSRTLILGRRPTTVMGELVGKSGDLPRTRLVKDPVFEGNRLRTLNLGLWTLDLDVGL